MTLNGENHTDGVLDPLVDKKITHHIRDEAPTQLHPLSPAYRKWPNPVSPLYGDDNLHGSKCVGVVYQGVYDGVLFWVCSDGKVRNRFKRGYYLRDRADKAIEEYLNTEYIKENGFTYSDLACGEGLREGFE